ncbi:MAG: AAA family ATPase [Dehalococcoidia bacterium]
MLCPSCQREVPPDSQFCNGCGARLDALATAAPASSLEEIPTPSALPPSGFVGRQREMGELKEALQDARSGQGRLVMLVGEPGIGKTRTAQETARFAEQQGFLVWWGRCYEEEGAPPYWPWIQPLRSYVQQTDLDQLGSQMGSGAADIAEIVSEIRNKLPDLEPPPALEPEQARFRLFDSITTFLKNAAQFLPLMLVLDDLHWADRSSLLLLEFIAQEIGGIPLFMIGTYRDVEVSRGHPLSVSLGNLVRQQGFSRMHLGGLSQQEVRELLETTSGASLSPDMVDTIHGRTEGYPLFVSEITQMLIREGLQEGEGHLPSTPEGVRETIGRRLSRLSEICNQIMTTAAFIGQEFDFRLLCTISEGIPENRLLEAIDEAVGAHLIEDVPGGRERYQFSHSLIQQTLVEGLTTSRRVRMHAQVGGALEELYGAEADAHAAELAYHFAEAETVTGAAKLAHYSLLAGKQALAVYAYEEALEHFERGLAARGVPLAETEPAKDAQEAGLLAGLGRAQQATLPRLQQSLAVATLGRAVDYYVDSGDIAEAVAVAESPTLSGIGRGTGMTHLIARVLPQVPPRSHAAGRLLCNYGLELGLAEVDYQGAQEAFRQALDIAQREGDTTLEARVMTSTFEVDIFHLHFQDATPKGHRAIELARSAGERSAETRSLTWTCRVMLLTGELEEAWDHLSTLLSLGEELRDRRFLYQALFFNQQSHQLVGDWATARDFHHRLLEVWARDVRHLCRRALLEYETGNPAEGQQYMERVLEVMPLTVAGPNSESALPAITVTAIARICGVMDHLEMAEAAVKTVLSGSPATPWIDSLARSGLGLLAVLRQDRAGAEEQYPALKPRQGTLVAEGFLTIDRLLGLLSQTMGNLDQAAAHFEDALAFCRKAGYRPELAWTCHDYADTLLQRNGSGDRAKAMSLLAEALSICQELGMRPLIERVVSLQDRAGSPPVKAPAYPDGLTQREVEVLRLLSAGKTDREIAQELLVSVRTVGGHVSNILNKTNSANRTEAAAYAALHGLISR